MTPIQRYLDTHLLWAKRNRPNVVKDGFYTPPKVPDVTKTNGLTDYCVNMVNWLEVGSLKRVNVVTRTSDVRVKNEAGTGYFNDKRYTKSIKKGSSDIIGSLRGRMINIEVKNKYTRDRFVEGSSQDKDRTRALRAGELYWIITCVEDFLSELDAFLYG